MSSVEIEVPTDPRVNERLHAAVATTAVLPTPARPPAVRPSSYVDPTYAIRTGRHDAPVYGMCTSCGAVEVALVRATGTRDLSSMGESAAYPTGYGCEVCA